MDYVFDLKEKGKRMVYTQGGLIVGLIPQGRMIRQTAVLQEDFLSDLAAVLHEGHIYYTYHNLEHQVILHRLEDDVPLPLLSDASNSSRYANLLLAVHDGTLFLFYTAYDSVREETQLRLLCPYRYPGREYICASGKAFCRLSVWGTGRGLVLYAFSDTDSFFWIEAGKAMEAPMIRALYLTEGEENRGRDCEKTEEEERKKEEREQEMLALRANLKETRQKLNAAIEQYERLRSQAMEIQEEGRRWRKKYLLREQSGTGQ